MHIPFVDLKAQYLTIKSEIDESISKVINETAFIGGIYVKQFEKEFENLYGVKHCISVANGTDSLYIILKMLGIKEGDEVITSSYSWISTPEAISQTGASPIFVDIDEYFSIDSGLIEAKISSKTKAILPVHIHGQMCDMDKIIRLAKKYNLFIIEDCAQSHFSEYKCKRAGTFGIASSFSFYPGKNLGAYGDAGCILTNDDDLALKFRMYANHGALVKHEHKIEGINSRMDGLQAAILNVKLKYILQWTEARKNVANIYNESLKNIPQLEIPIKRGETEHSYHLYVVKAQKRDELKMFLMDNGIETVIHYPKCLPNLDCYSEYMLSSNSKIASNNESTILSLPIYPELDINSVKYVIEKIREFYCN